MSTFKQTQERINFMINVLKAPTYKKLFEIAKNDETLIELAKEDLYSFLLGVFAVYNYQTRGIPINETSKLFKENGMT